MILDQIKQDAITALKSGDKRKASFLRFLVSELKNVQIDKRDSEFTDEDAVEVLQKEQKRHNESIEIYQEKGEMERVTEERFELNLIEEYLPQQLSEEEIEEIVEDIIDSQDDPNIGSVMKAVMSQVKGQADGKTVNQIVRNKLS